MKKEKKLPSFTEQLSNFAEFAKDFIKDPSSVSKEDYRERLEECNACPHLVYNKYTKQPQCSLCGCHVIFKAKKKVSTCPDNRWKKQ